MKERKKERIKGKARRRQSSRISREGEYSVEVSRTIGWTMMDEEPKESEADAAAFLLPDFHKANHEFPPPSITTTIRHVDAEQKH